MLSQTSFLDNLEAQNIVESLAAGPKAFWEIERYLYVCCGSESRANTTCDLLDELVTAGIVVYRGDSFYLQTPVIMAGRLTTPDFIVAVADYPSPEGTLSLTGRDPSPAGLAKAAERKVPDYV